MFIKDNIMDKTIEKTGWNLKMGRMNWQADSWHVYGKDIRQLEERLINRLDKSTFDESI